MDKLLQWCTSVRLELDLSEGQVKDHLFFSESINYSSSFVPVMPPDDILEQMLVQGTTVYTIYVDAVFIGGKPTYDSSWRYTPKPVAVRLGFAGSNQEETIARIITWFEEHTDKEKEPCMVPYSSMKRNVQPVITRTKCIPHWKEDT